MEAQVVAGASIADAMKKKPRFFAKIDILMIDAAERSGNLPEALDMLSKWYEFRHNIINKIKSGLVLPIIVLNIASFVIPVPDFVHGDIHLGGYLGEAWSILRIFYLPAAIVLLILFLGKTLPILRYLLDYILLWVPALGKGLFNLSLSRYCRSFYMLSVAGLDAIETAETSIELTGNHFVKSLVEGSGKAVRAGKNVSDGFKKERLPAEFVNLWHVGEESGTIDKATLKLADLTADRAEFWLSCFAAWLPRIIYFAVMIFLAYKILGGYSDIYSGLGSGY